MDAATALRVKKVEIMHQAAQKSAEIQAQRCVAVLAVGLTVGASAAVAGIAGQLPALASMGGAGAGSWTVVSQLRALRLLSRDLERATRDAVEAIDKLMTSGGESDVDAQADEDGA